MDTMMVARPAILRQTLTFSRHFAEMCVSMCAVGMPLTALALSMASTFSGIDVRDRFPELGLLLIALTLTLPMTGWMLFRGMGVPRTLEMAAAAFAIAVVLIVAVTAGAAGRGWLAIRIGEFCGLSCIAMFALMLARLDLYTGRAGTHAAHAT